MTPRVFLFLFAALVAADPVPVTVTITVPMECPACPVATPCPPPIDRDPWLFGACMTGPMRRIGGVDDSDLWSYRTLDEEHTMIGWQVYFRLCRIFDRDYDGDVDLRDFAVFQNRLTPGAGDGQ